MPDVEEIVCRELVELVTDYLEGVLAPERHSQIEEHLIICEGCAAYVEQMEQTLSALRRVRSQELSPQRRRQLLDVFREWAEETPR